MAKSLELRNIGWPTDYIRRDPDMNHIADLRDVIQRSDKNYPFSDPILVRQLDKPALYSMTMGGKGGTCEYELLKGLHRCLALQLNKDKTVMADIERFTSVQIASGEALFAQYDDHGVLKVSIKDRAHFIKALRSQPYKWSVEQVAERFKISTASVSRIARNLQATGPSGKPRKARTKKGAPAETFNSSEWFTILGELTKAYQENLVALIKDVTSVDPDLFIIARGMLDELSAARNAAGG